MQETYLGKAINFAGPAGEPALLAPDSVQWRIYKNQIALGIGGIAAVLLEFAEPRIRSGVWDHSTYKADPIGRSRRTGTVALLGAGLFWATPFGPLRGDMAWILSQSSTDSTTKVCSSIYCPAFALTMQTLL